MKTAGRILVSAIALSLVASAAHAGGSFPTTAFQLSVGAVAAGDPIPALASSDGTYLDIDSRRAGNARKVVYKTTHGGMPTADDTLGLSWNGQTNLKHSCEMTFSILRVRNKKWVLVGTETIPEGPANAAVSMLLPDDDDSQFVNANGKAKAKASCKDDVPFTLKTDRFILSS